MRPSLQERSRTSVRSAGRASRVGRTWSATAAPTPGRSPTPARCAASAFASPTCSRPTGRNAFASATPPAWTSRWRLPPWTPLVRRSWGQRCPPRLRPRLLLPQASTPSTEPSYLFLCCTPWGGCLPPLIYPHRLPCSLPVGWTQTTNNTSVASDALWFLFVFVLFFSLELLRGLENDWKRQGLIKNTDTHTHLPQ